MLEREITELEHGIWRDQSRILEYVNKSPETLDNIEGNLLQSQK